MAKKQRYRDLSKSQKDDVENSYIGEQAEVNPNLKRVSKRAVKKQYKQLKKSGKLAEVVGKGYKAAPPQPAPSAPEEVKVVKQTVEGTSPEITNSEHLAAVKKAVSGSKNGVLDSEAYDAINKEYKDKQKANGYAEGEGVVEPNPTEVIEENARNQAVINHTTNEDYEQTAEKIAALPEARKAVSEIQAGQHAAITKALDEEDKEAQGITTSTGELVDDVITREGIAAHQDETYNAMISGNPAWKAMGENYRKTARKTNAAGGEPAIEALGLTQYYPDINQPIAKGSYSRSMLGSGNIYVGGGGFFPIGVVDARRRALEKEAQVKAKKKQEVMELMFAQGAPQYQDQLTNMSMSMLNDFGEAAGWDWSKMLDMDTKLSREFWKESFGIQDFAKRSLFINNRVDGILNKAYATDGVYVPQVAIDAGVDWMEGGMNLEELRKDKKKVEKIERTVQAYDNMTTTAETIVEVMQQDETLLNINTAEPFQDPEEAAEFADAMKTFQGGNVDDKYWATLKLVGEDRIDAMVESYFPRRKHYIGSGTPKEIEAGMLDLKKMIVNSISTNVELKTKTLNHGKARMALKWYKAKKEEEDARIWTTINNRSKNNDVKSGLDGLLSATDDPKGREENLVGGYTQAMHVEGHIDKETGMLFGNIPLQQGQKNAAQDISAGATGVSYKYDFGQGIIGRTATAASGERGVQSATLDEIQARIRLKGQKEWTDQDHAFMQMNSETVLPNYTMVEARHGYGRKGKDGKTTYIGVDSEAGDAEMSDDYAQLIYGGSVTIEKPVLNAAGEQESVVWFTETGKGTDKAPEAVKIYDSAKMKEFEDAVDKDGKPKYNKGSVTLETVKTTVNMPNMTYDTPISDPIARTVLDTDWGTSGKTIQTTAGQEGEYRGREDEGTGSTGQNDSEDVEL